jgi:hypothetical protein
MIKPAEVCISATGNSSAHRRSGVQHLQVLPPNWRHDAKHDFSMPLLKQSAQSRDHSIDALPPGTSTQRASLTAHGCEARSDGSCALTASTIAARSAVVLDCGVAAAAACSTLRHSPLGQTIREASGSCWRCAAEWGCTHMLLCIAGARTRALEGPRRVLRW